MAHAYHHAVSSAKTFGGRPEDYQAVHSWFDASKELHPDNRHRALRHHTQGIFESERVFGTTISNSNGRNIPTRWIGEQHVREDMGFIPRFTDWISEMTLAPWMVRGAKRLSREIEDADHIEQAQTPSAPTAR